MQGLPARYAADPTLLDKALSLQPSDISLHPGLIVTGDWFVDSKDKMRDILGHFPETKAVDMESCAIAPSPSSPSASSATFPCATPMLLNTTISGKPSPTTLSKSPAPSSRVYNYQLSIIN